MKERNSEKRLSGAPDAPVAIPSWLLTPTTEGIVANPEEVARQTVEEARKTIFAQLPPSEKHFSWLPQVQYPKSGTGDPSVDKQAGHAYD